MQVRLTALALAAALAPLAAQAQDSGDWIVRARAVNLSSANSDDTGLSLSINVKVLPEQPLVDGSHLPRHGAVHAARRRRTGGRGHRRGLPCRTL